MLIKVKLYYVENKKVYIEGSNSKKEIKDNASLFTIEFPEDFFNLKNASKLKLTLTYWI